MGPGAPNGGSALAANAERRRERLPGPGARAEPGLNRRLSPQRKLRSGQAGAESRVPKEKTPLGGCGQ